MSFRQLQDFDRTALDDAAEKWQAHAKALREKADAIETEIGNLSDWEGDGGEAARSSLKKLKNLMDDSADEIDKIPEKITNAAESIEDAQNSLAYAITGAGDDIEVSEDGTVSKSWKAGIETEQMTEDRKKRQEELRTAIEDAVRKATEADEDGASAIRGIVPSEVGIDIGSGAGGTAAEIPEGKSPEKVNEWWDGLSPMQKESLLFSDSAKIGNLDGIPSDVRDRANRFVLAEHKVMVEQQLDTTEGDARTALREKLDGIEDIENSLDKDDAMLLGFDAQAPGKDGTAIISIGNPDTADNVTTTVPGTYAGMSSAGTDIGKSEAVHESMTDADPDGEHAAITWTGYDAPDDLPAAIPSEPATDGAESLAAFQAGLDATDESGDARHTVMGHSYGGAVVGHALNNDGPMNPDHVDDAVFVGAPGAGVSPEPNPGHGTSPTPAVEDMGLDGEHVWATRATSDATGLAPGNGSDPTSSTFGAQVFDSDNPSWWNVEENHTSYWDEDKNPTALENMGKIAVGQEPDATSD